MDQSIRLIDSDPAASAALMDANELDGHPHDDKPFVEVLAAMGERPLPLPPQFVLAMQDVIGEDGVTTIEIAGVQRPEHFDHTSPCHVVGTWIRTNLPAIIDAARSATQVQPSALRLPDGSLIGAR